jgi:uncharacterized protein YunC (DUF1805 family)
MVVKDFEIKGQKVTGLEVPLPKAPLVLAKAGAGFVMCGYLNIEAAEKMGECAAMVRGVKTIQDLLLAKVAAATSKAREKGVQIDMTGQDALLCLS